MSGDSGLTWRASGFNDRGMPKSIAITSEGIIYLWLSTGSYPDSTKGIYRSIDGGESWLQEISKPSTVYGAVTVASDGRIFAGFSSYGDDNGVLISSDNGETWVAENTGFTSSHVRSLVQSSHGFVFAGTYHGVFRSHAAITDVNSGEGNPPSSFYLSQNYPNPFNPSTTISFSLPHSAGVTLKVLNTLGEEVATLLSGEMETGTHLVQWDATGYPTGVYFYRLQTGTFLETRKLVLLK
jgi:hypothetical protein